MRSTRSLALASAILIGFHLLVALAPFFAPYHYAEQNRELPLAPPMRVHLVDPQGKWKWRPFVYAWAVEDGDTYREDRTRRFPIRFLVGCSGHEILGVLPSRWHLFGVDEPGRVFLLGTDFYGRGYFSRLLYGGQISLLAGILGATISLGLALVVGGLAGYYGRWIDELMMRVTELFLALPWLYLLFAARAFFPLNLEPWQAFLLITTLVGLVGWARPARLVRGIVLSSKERDFVQAALSFGASDRYLLWRHVLPQARSVLVTQAAILVPHFILAEVTLSFLGLGVAEPLPSWGNMLAALQQYHPSANAMPKCEPTSSCACSPTRCNGT